MARVMCVLAVAALVVTSDVWAADHEVRLHRPSKVGDAYRIEAEARVTAKTTMKSKLLGDTTSEQDSTVELQATVKVLETDADGSPTKLSLNVVKCFQTRKQRAQLIPAGAVVTVRRVGVAGFACDIGGQPAPKKVTDALDNLFLLDAGPDEREFGTKGRKRVGQSWPANGTAIAADLREGGVAVRPGDIKGSATLHGVVSESGIPCLDIRATLAVRCVPAPATGMRTKSTYTWLCPLDPSLPVVRERREIVGTLTMSLPSAPGEPPSTVKTDSTHIVKCRYTHLK